MKKRQSQAKAAIILLIITMILCFTGCSFQGYDWIDTNYHFNKAIIKMPDGEIITVEIAQWANTADGEQLTITGKDGKRYLVSSINCILVEDTEAAK